MVDLSAMTSSHYPQLYCLICGEQVQDMDALQEHQASCDKREDNKELRRAIRDTLKNR